MAKLTDKSAFQGETLSATFHADAAATGITVTLKDGTSSAVIAATKNPDGSWGFKASPDQLNGFEGRTNWVAIAVSQDGSSVIASGHIFIRPLVSKWREVVDAIEEAIKGWGTNANQTITVGEISITAKTLDDLIAARNHFKQKADADEAGRESVGGPRIMLTCFGR